MKSKTENPNKIDEDSNSIQVHFLSMGGISTLLEFEIDGFHPVKNTLSNI